MIIENFIEIEPLNSDEFLKVTETLTRCGIKSTKEDIPTLWQSCHVLHKQNRYYIVHFKELFLLDGKCSEEDIDDMDYARRNLIAKNLEDWGLIKLITKIEVPKFNIPLTIISYNDKQNWKLKTKYSIGKLNKKIKV